jgi:hypothetical protein
MSQMLFNPKHDLGLVLFGSQTTANKLSDDVNGEAYQNVVTEREIGPIDLNFFR